VIQSLPVQQPLALVLYEKLMPGSQLVNRLTDLKYRVHALTDPSQLLATAQSLKPLLILADLLSKADIPGEIACLRADKNTSHIPVVAFAQEGSDELVARAEKAGATLVVTDAAVITHLPQLLDQALRVD
jgi:PleD family two-component response regulator